MEHATVSASAAHVWHKCLPESPGGLTSVIPFGYAGGYTDPDGLIYLINRYYNPQTGQFISVDPRFAQTLDAYVYAGDNPVSATDPSGLCSQTWCPRAPVNVGGGGVKHSYPVQGPTCPDTEPGCPGYVAPPPPPRPSLPADSKFVVVIGSMVLMGEVRGGAYTLPDPVTKVVMYVGRSVDVERRLAQWARDDEKDVLEPRVELWSDDYGVLRGGEQIIFEENGGPPLNVVRPIGPTNPKISEYKSAAQKALDEWRGSEGESDDPEGEVSGDDWGMADFWGLFDLETQDDE